MANVNLYAAGAIMSDFRSIVDRHVDELLDNGRKDDALSALSESWSKAAAFMGSFVNVDGGPTEPSPVVPSPAPIKVNPPTAPSTVQPVTVTVDTKVQNAKPAVRRTANQTTTTPDARIGSDGKKIRGRKPMPDVVKAIKVRLIDTADVDSESLALFTTLKNADPTADDGTLRRKAGQQIGDKYSKAAWREACKTGIVAYDLCPEYAQRDTERPTVVQSAVVAPPSPTVELIDLGEPEPEPEPVPSPSEPTVQTVEESDVPITKIVSPDDKGYYQGTCIVCEKTKATKSKAVAKGKPYTCFDCSGRGKALNAIRAAAAAEKAKNNPTIPTATEPITDTSPKLTGKAALKNAKIAAEKPAEKPATDDTDPPKGKPRKTPKNASTEAPTPAKPVSADSDKAECKREFRDEKNAPKKCTLAKGHDDGPCTFISPYTGETVVDPSYVAPEPVPANAKPRKAKPVQAPAAVDTVVTRYPHQSKAGQTWTVSTVQDEDSADHVLLTNKDAKTIPVNPQYAIDAKQESQEIVMPDIDGGILRVPCKTPKAARKLLADLTAAVDQLTA